MAPCTSCTKSHKIDHLSSTWATHINVYTPPRLTWNIIMEVWKIIILSKRVICRFLFQSSGDVSTFICPVPLEIALFPRPKRSRPAVDAFWRPMFVKNSWQQSFRRRRSPIQKHPLSTFPNRAAWEDPQPARFRRLRSPVVLGSLQDMTAHPIALQLVASLKLCHLVWLISATSSLPIVPLQTNVQHSTHTTPTQYEVQTPPSLVVSLVVKG